MNRIKNQAHIRPSQQFQDCIHQLGPLDPDNRLLNFLKLIAIVRDQSPSVQRVCVAAFTRHTTLADFEC